MGHFSKSRQSKTNCQSLHDIDGDVDARMHWAHYVIAVVNEVNVNRILIAPARRHRPAHHEPVTAILEARTAAGNNHGTDDHEAVFVSKMRVEAIFRDVVVVMFNEGHVVDMAVALMLAPFGFTPLTSFMTLEGFTTLVFFVLTPFMPVTVMVAHLAPVMIVAAVPNLAPVMVVAAITSFVAAAIVMVASFTLAVVLIAPMPGISVMIIVLGERRYGCAHGKGQNCSQAYSHQLHVVLLHVRIDYQPRALCCCFAPKVSGTLGHVQGRLQLWGKVA